MLSFASQYFLIGQRERKNWEWVSLSVFVLGEQLVSVRAVVGMRIRVSVAFTRTLSPATITSI